MVAVIKTHEMNLIRKNCLFWFMVSEVLIHGLLDPLLGDGGEMENMVSLGTCNRGCLTHGTQTFLLKE